jgi:DNA-binding NarL/FixJ family response regulator
MARTSLTARQREILQCAFDFDGDLQKVADEKCIAECTVKNHLYLNIFPTLSVHSLCGAFRAGLALKLIDLDESIRKNPPLAAQDVY